MTCNVLRAAQNTKKILFEKRPECKDFDIARDDEGKKMSHALWMLNEIEFRIAGEKAHRWLGYAQGILVHGDYLTLEDVKRCNFFT